MERGQNITINKSLKKVNCKSHEWLWEVQDFSGGSNSIRGRSNKRVRIRIRTGPWTCDWIVAVSW